MLGIHVSFTTSRLNAQPRLGINIAKERCCMAIISGHQKNRGKTLQEAMEKLVRALPLLNNGKIVRGLGLQKFRVMRHVWQV